MMPVEETAMINAGGASQKRERTAGYVRGDQIPYGCVIVGKRFFCKARARPQNPVWVGKSDVCLAWLFRLRFAIRGRGFPHDVGRGLVLAQRLERRLAQHVGFSPATEFDLRDER